MEKIFGEHILALAIFVGISIALSGVKQESQRIILLYLFFFIMAITGTLTVWASILLLIVATFILIEYLTEDSAKIKILSRFRYRMYDFLFMGVFQYHIIPVVSSMVVARAPQFISMTMEFGMFFLLISLYPFLKGTHLALSQPFKIKEMGQIMQVFEEFPLYNFQYKVGMQTRFDLICAFEDKTFFSRHNSYSCFSLEYIRERNSFIGAIKQIPAFLRNPRGYSSPETQLLRTIGVERGYEEYKFQRKIFEIIYSKIIFSSLKAYYQSNTYRNTELFRQYILYVYIHKVLTRIGDQYYRPMSSMFKDRGIESWPMEDLFVGCMGLSFRGLESLERYRKVINQFSLNDAEVEKSWRKYAKEQHLEYAGVRV